MSQDNEIELSAFFVDTEKLPIIYPAKKKSKPKTDVKTLIDAGYQLHIMSRGVIQLVKRPF